MVIMIMVLRIVMALGSNNGNENGSVTDNSTVAESLNIKLQDASGAVISKVQDNSVILVAVQVLNADKGGIANKDVRLSINDTDGLNVTASHHELQRVMMVLLSLKLDSRN